MMDFIALLFAVLASLLSVASTVYIARRGQDIQRVDAKFDATVQRILANQQADLQRSLAEARAQHEIHLKKIQHHFDLEKNNLEHSMQLELNQREQEARAQESMIVEMRALVTLIERVQNSTRRFTQLSGYTADGETLVEQATNTFAVLAEFIAKTPRGTLSTFPEQVATALGDVRRELTQYFSQIDLRPRSQPVSNALLNGAQNKLESQINTADAALRIHLAPPPDNIYIIPSNPAQNRKALSFAE